MKTKTTWGALQQVYRLDYIRPTIYLLFIEMYKEFDYRLTDLDKRIRVPR